MILDAQNNQQTQNTLFKTFGFYGGCLTFLLLIILPNPDSIDIKNWRLLAIIIFMVFWWISEAVPLAITSLLPLVLMPLLDVMPIEEVSGNYAHPIIFLLFSGFALTAALKKWNLHLRIALNIIKFTGIKATHILAGFMITTAFISMWINNTATTLIMLPIAVSILELFKKDELLDKKSQTKFEIALLLSAAFSANIGGAATLIGTPPNIMLAAFLKENFNYEITFVKWMMFGFPFSLTSLVLCWFLLVFVFRLNSIGKIEGSDQIIKQQLANLGKIKYEEKIIAIIFCFTSTLWMVRPLLNIPHLDDTIIALLSVFALFALPIKSASSKFLLKWEDSKNLPWDVIILFGSGLTIALALKNSGILVELGNLVSNSFSSYNLLVIIVISAIKFAGEIIGNSVFTPIMLPIIGAISNSYDRNPLYLMVAAGMASSCDFMLPTSTPSNALVLSGGNVSVGNMIKAGLLMNIITIILTIFFLFLILPRIL